MLATETGTNRRQLSVTELRGAAALIPWFLIHTQPCRERAAIAKLNSFGLPTFMPLTPEKKRFDGSYCPLFPSYLFASFPHEVHRDVNESLSRLPLLGRVVYFGTTPAEVAGALIQEIAKRLNDDGLLDLSGGSTGKSACGTKFNSGDRVEITDGSMKGILGVFDRYKSGQERAVILVSTVMSTQGWNCSRRPLERHGAAFTLNVDARSLARV